VRVFEDTFNVLLMRAGYPREMKPFLGASSKRTRKELNKLQRSGTLDRVSRYFCQSPLAAAKRPQSVDILWEVKQVHYGTGQVRTDLFYAHSFDCKRNSTRPANLRKWNPVRGNKGELMLEPTSTPGASGKGTPANPSSVEEDAP